MRLLLVTLVLGTSLFAQDTARSAAIEHSASPADLEIHQWRIAQFSLNGERTNPYHKPGKKGEPYIRFESGRIEGSPGCGQFLGEYIRKNDSLTVSLQWTHDKKTACDTEEEKNARRVLTALRNVRRIQAAPVYWRPDLLELMDKKGRTNFSLFPMQPGEDLSEVRDTFWRLAQLKDSTAELSGVIVDIEERAITFSTPYFFSSFPYEYRLTGLRFFPASGHGTDGALQHEQVQTQFENALHMIATYELSAEKLTFFSKDREPIIVLSPIRQEGIENRRWRIAKYRNDGSKHRGEDALVETKYLPEITFLNGRVEGSPGCGSWMGTYHLAGNDLRTEAAPVLIGRCNPEAETESHLVVSAFGGNLRIEEEHDRVSLRDENGKAQVLLEPY